MCNTPARAWKQSFCNRANPDELCVTIAVANFLNFRYLGPQHRVAYVASCGVIWNTFISLLNKFKDDEAAAAATEATEDAPKGLRELVN